MGVFHGFRRKHVNAYLDQFVFRWDRRHSYRSAFERPVGVGVAIRPATCTDLEPPMQPELHSEFTCPHCGHRKVEEMPTDACQFFYECEGCSTLLRPKAGDCCVFCSYGSAPCPPIQLARQDGGKGCCGC